MNLARSIRLGAFTLVAAVAYGSPTIDSTGIDRSVQPTADFYRFANGGWLSEAKIPADQSGVGTFNLLSDRNEEITRQVVEDAAKNPPDHPRSPIEKVGLFYKVGMDEERANRLGIDPLKPEIALEGTPRSTPQSGPYRPTFPGPLPSAWSHRQHS